MKSEALEELKATIVSSAAEAVVAQMTPAMMRRVAEEMLETVLESLTSDKYGRLGRMIQDKTEVAMQEHLKTEQAQRLIEGAVVRGVNEAAQSVDAEVRNKIVRVALDGVHKALTTKPGY